MARIVAFTLRRLRTAKGLSLEQLAERAKIDKQTIWRLEKDESTNAREHTIGQLARALGVEPAVLTGKAAVPPTEDDSEYSLMSKLNFRISTRAHNALSLVGQRYFVTHQEIVELAPLLFCWAAEASLNQRRERLKNAERAREVARELEREITHLPPNFTPSEERFAAESGSIDCRDIFGIHLENDGFGYADNPFAIFLDGLVKEIGSDADFQGYGNGDAPEYHVCAEEASYLVEDDSALAEHILNGHVALNEMPKDLRHNIGLCKERVEWVRAKAAEYREKMHVFVERIRSGGGGP